MEEPLDTMVAGLRLVLSYATIIKIFNAILLGMPAFPLHLGTEDKISHLLNMKLTSFSTHHL